MTVVQVRRLHRDDAVAYRALRLTALRTDPECFGAAHETEAALPLEAHAARLETSAVFAAVFAAGVAAAFAAVSETGPPIGLAGLRRESGASLAHKALLWGFWVAPAARGQGVGDALMQAVLDHARTCVVQVHLTVLHRNAPAIALYARFGFVEYGREPRAIRTSAGLEDERLMARLL